MKPLLNLIFLVFISCNHMAPAEEKAKEKDLILPVPPKQYTFFDSIQNGFELTTAQVALHLPEFSTTSTFTGSRVLFPKAKSYAIVILNEDDHVVCSNQYLVAMDKTTLVATDSRLVHNDCEVDYGFNTNKSSYRLLNDSSFLVIETAYIARDTDVIVPPIDSTFITWQISSSGKMIKQQEIRK